MFFLKVEFSIEIFMPPTVIIFEINFPLKKSYEFLRISDSGFVHVVFEGTLALIIVEQRPSQNQEV